MFEQSARLVGCAKRTIARAALYAAGVLRTPYGSGAPGSARAWLLLAAMLACGLLAGCSKPPTTSPNSSSETPASVPTGNSLVRIAAAADLRFALEELIAEFQKTEPDIKLEATYGSSGNLFAQLANKAPFDIFFSADRLYAHQLVEQQLADADSEFVYGIGQIVVWVPNSSPLDLKKAGIGAVVDAAVRKVAIANPEHAPYGRAAETAFRSLGVYDQVRDRLVLGENVAQAAQFVESGAADVGVIALSLAMAPTMRDKGRYWNVPLDAYPRLEQAGVVLKSAADADAARRFRAFVINPRGQELLARYGFIRPEK
jgi:molybdate transport system substrate-binding protein